LYPASYEDPLFNIHLNVDYPFKLTGILYFPKIRNNIEIQKNKIQLYCNQVYVTDSVEGIVPDFLTLLHGVLDSPDIPLNVSRSYLLGDPNVKKISGHITKKVADRLADIFKNTREDFEKKWDDLRLFIQYGILTDEKFYDRAKDFFMLKNTDNKYFTFEEYEKLVKENQTDKDKNCIYLYCTDTESQYSFVDAAKSKGYDVLVMNGQLDAHFINTLETKTPNTKYVRVDSDVVEKLIRKDEAKESKLSKEDESRLSPVFESVVPTKGNFSVVFETLSENDMPVMLTQAEFMCRMKDMAKTGSMGFYADLPDNYNMVINTNHHLVNQVLTDLKASVGDQLADVEKQMKPVKSDMEALEKLSKDKKQDEIPQQGIHLSL